MNSKIKKRISLVLGSGGARGYAHIGVIEELERHGYEIVAISGASMGALIGALYLCGALPAYKAWVLDLDPIDVARLLDFSWDKRGIVKGEKLFFKLNEWIADRKIEDLPIPYTAVATDIRRNKEVWFQRGSLLEAVRASISIPSFFTPIEREGMLLVDGGVLNPLPVAPLMATPSEMIVAVSLYGDGKLPSLPTAPKIASKESSLQSLSQEILERFNPWSEEKADDSYHLFDVIDMTLETMQKSLISYRLGGYPPDLMIEIPQDICGTLDFYKAYEVIETGRLITAKTLFH